MYFFLILELDFNCFHFVPLATPPPAAWQAWEHLPLVDSFCHSDSFLTSVMADWYSVLRSDQMSLCASHRMGLFRPCELSSVTMELYSLHSCHQLYNSRTFSACFLTNRLKTVNVFPSFYLLVDAYSNVCVDGW